MKKIILVTLALAIGMTGFAQTKYLRAKAEKAKLGSANFNKKIYNGFNEAPIMSFAPSQAAPTNPNKEADTLDFQTMMTNYDLQSNGFVANRMHRFDDGTVGVVATWSQRSNLTDRGTGYNYFNGSEFLFDVETNPISGRIENEKTGWPAYTQYGPNGEIAIAHAEFGTANAHLTYYTRETKGEGEWQGPKTIPNPTHLDTPANLLTWPKIATSGANHDIIHVLGCDQDEENLADSYLYYSRSTDGENWTTTFIPTLEDWEHTLWSSDYYALAANGNTVAILLVGNARSNGYVIKSTDNGEHWTQIKYWDNPYAGLDWETDENSIFDEDNPMYGPETGAICIDNDGMVHCAFSATEFIHNELGTSYSIYYGKYVDGIFYWNETMGTLKAPEWVYPEDTLNVMPSNPHNVFRLWWPGAEESDYIYRNLAPTNCVGFLPSVSEVNNDDIYYGDDYQTYWFGTSVLPAICVDESGAIAIGYSAPDVERRANDGKYLRSIYVTYLEAPYHMGDHYGEITETAGDVYYLMARLQDADDFMHSYDEAVALCSPQNTTNLEFWFSYQADEMPGFYIGNNSQQSSATYNYIWATMFKPDIEGLAIEENIPAPNTQMELYPNPAISQLNMRLENDAQISIYNIMGQNMLSMQGMKGVNTINVSDLTSGVYFISAGTVTQKFIVK